MTDAQKARAAYSKRYTSWENMRIVLIWLLMFSSNALACKTNEPSKILAFASEFEADSGVESDSLRTFEILSPIQKEDMFFLGVIAIAENEFRINLEFSESKEYLGGYYSSYLSIANKYVKDLKIIIDYNATDKDRNGIAFCANWVSFDLEDLLQAPKAEKAPLPTNPPPPPPRKIDV